MDAADTSLGNTDEMSGWTTDVMRGEARASTTSRPAHAAPLHSTRRHRNASPSLTKRAVVAAFALATLAIAGTAMALTGGGNQEPGVALSAPSPEGAPPSDLPTSPDSTTATPVAVTDAADVAPAVDTDVAPAAADVAPLTAEDCDDSISPGNAVALFQYPQALSFFGAAPDPDNPVNTIKSILQRMTPDGSGLLSARQIAAGDIPGSHVYHNLELLGDNARIVIIGYAQCVYDVTAGNGSGD